MASKVATPRPTCKVVLRTYEGTRGARIHPKGCKVRSHAADATRKNIRKYNKNEVEKYKIKTKQKELSVYVRRTVNGVIHRKKFIWDTRATAARCGVVLARQWGIIHNPSASHSGSADDSTGAFRSQRKRIQGANGNIYYESEYRNVPVEVEVKINGQLRLYPITMNLGVAHNNSHLISAPNIASLRKQGLSVSFGKSRR